MVATAEVRRERSARLNQVAVAGYDAAHEEENPYLRSSPCSMAWSLGFWMRAAGYPAPSEVRQSVGYSMWANGGLFDVTYERAPRVVRAAPAADPQPQFTLG